MVTGQTNGKHKLRLRQHQNNADYADNAEYLTDGPGFVLQISALPLWSLQQAGRWLRVWGGRRVSHQRADANQDSSDSPACINMYPCIHHIQQDIRHPHRFIQLLGCHCLELFYDLLSLLCCFDSRNFYFWRFCKIPRVPATVWQCSQIAELRRQVVMM